MRKQLKDKKKCCKLCKPHKRGWANRWKPKEIQLQKEFEKDKGRYRLRS